MGVTSDFEKRVIQAMLAFANLKTIRSTKQVEELFFPLADERFQTIPTKDKWAFEDNQRELRKWLEEISKGGTAGVKQIRSQLNERLKAVRLRPVLEEGKAKYKLSIDGVQAAYSYALWLILDEKRGLINRLNKCGAPGCGRFRLDFEGKPRRHCNEKHRRAADKLTGAKRQKEYRARQAKKEKF